MGEHTEVSLRNVIEKDLEIVFTWQKKVRKFFLNPTPPTFEEHKKWFLEIINSANSLYYIIMYRKNECGAIRFDYSVKTKKYTLSWYVIPEFQGVGIGTNAIILALKKIKNAAEIIANVHPENIASVKSLTKAGFRKIDHNTFCYEKLDEGFIK